MTDEPIGVFDSGLGGLTVLRALIDLLPDERMVYFGDTGRFPYGPKPQHEVPTHELDITDVPPACGRRAPTSSSSSRPVTSSPTRCTCWRSDSSPPFATRTSTPSCSDVRTIRSWPVRSVT